MRSAAVAASRKFYSIGVLKKTRFKKKDTRPLWHTQKRSSFYLSFNTVFQRVVG